MTYKCIKSLKTVSGELHQYGAVISVELYKQLTEFERRHFVKLEKDFMPQKKNENDLNLGNTEMELLNSSFQEPTRFDNDFLGNPTEQPGNNYDSGTPDNFDYGGGDSGGAGASGDY